MTLAKWTDDLGDFADYWTIVPGDLQIVGQSAEKHRSRDFCGILQGIVRPVALKGRPD